MKMDAFFKLFPVPEEPFEPGDPKKWPAVEKKLSTKLPSDYKTYIEQYGTGCISMFLWIFNPFSQNKNLNLIEQVDSYRKQYERMGEESKKYPFFPEKGGLLPFGVTDNGDVFYWLTRSENPDRWKIAINKSRSDEYEIFNRRLATFLVDAVKGKIESEVFSKDVIEPDKLFLPADQVTY